MGWDSFGLPAENAAIREGGHPRDIVERNIAEIRTQMKRIGWAIDWDREVGAHEPDVLPLDAVAVPEVLRARARLPQGGAGELVPERPDRARERVRRRRPLLSAAAPLVEARNMEQWFMKITAYADELLEYDLPPRRRVAGADDRDPAQLDRAQRRRGDQLPDRGAGHRHSRLHDPARHAVRRDLLRDRARAPAGRADRHGGVLAYARLTAAKRGEERATEEEKTGVFTGYYATNPVNGERLPIWVADYVLMDYGTGAIMAVPAHDERDYEFARTFDLPVRTVVAPRDGDPPEEGAYSAHTQDEILVNSAQFTGMASPEAKEKIVEWLEEQGKGAPAVSYRLRDWSMSRQRYWGCPIPIVHCDECGLVPVPEEQLPLLLPEVEDYRPKGVPPLASNLEWLNVDCPSCGGPGTREADTMDTFVDSAWYYLRYVDPHNDEAPFGRREVDYWCPVDHYIGGIDHATGHLLYSRFFVRVMNELGLVGFREPFARVFHQGWVQMGGSKMSKSKGNVEGPDPLVAEYGADAVRLYILFIGPGRPGHGVDGERHREA